MQSFHDYSSIIQLLAPSVLTAAGVGVGASFVGPFVLMRREGLTALALPQVVAVGVAIGLRYAWPPLLPALIAVAMAVVFLTVSRRWESHHWLLPSLYVAGISISFLFIANSGAHLEEMQNMFTGVEVAVTPETALITVPIVLLIGSICLMFWRRWLLIAQAPAAAELAGLHPSRWNALFLCLLATFLLLGTSALGSIMVLAMLFLPAATVLPWTKRIPATLLLAACASIVFLAAGFVLSVEMSWPLSQSVGGFGFCALVFSHLAARLCA